MEKPFSDNGLYRIKEEKLQKLYATIRRNNNLCDITQVSGDMIPDDTDLLTYSFLVKIFLLVQFGTTRIMTG